MAVAIRILAQSASYLAPVSLFGAATGAWAWASVVTATLTGLEFGIPLVAYSRWSNGSS